MSYFASDRIAKFNFDSSTRQDMNPKSLGIAQPIVFGLDFRKHDLFSIRTPEK